MLDFFRVLIPLLLIHIICDFYLQANQWAEEKKGYTYRSPALYLYSLLHGVALIVPAAVLGIDGRSVIYLVVIVTSSHCVFELWKVATNKGNKSSCFAIGQALHISILAAFAFTVTDGITMNTVLQHDNFSNGVLVVFAYLLILKPSSIVIGRLLRNYPIASSGSESDPSVSGLVAGGELIGYLERVLILTFTLVGSYAAVGFVLAAKSIFRFGELSKSNHRSMTEYVLIGSLISVVITTLIGTLVSLVLGMNIK